MSYKRVLLVILIISISGLLVYFLVQMEQSATQQTAESRPIPLLIIGSEVLQKNK